MMGIVFWLPNIYPHLIKKIKLNVLLISLLDSFESDLISVLSCLVLYFTGKSALIEGSFILQAHFNFLKNLFIK